MTNNFDNGFIATECVLSFLAILIVGLRLRGRKIMSQNIGPDDAIILFCLIFSLGLGCMGIYTSIRFTPLDFNPKIHPYGFSKYRKFMFVDVVITHFVWGLIKISVALFYRRIFFVSRSFNIRVWIYIAIVAGWMASAFFGQVFSQKWGQLPPVKYNIKWPKFILAMNAIDITLDVIVLAMPWPMLLKMQMSAKKKLYVGCIFLLGALCIVASCVRLYYTQSIFRAVGNVRISKLNNLWAHIECFASVIAACLPTLGPIMKLLPNIAITRPSLQSLLRSLTFSRGTESGDSGKDSTAETSYRVHQGPGWVISAGEERMTKTASEETLTRTLHSQKSGITRKQSVDMQYNVDCELGDLSPHAR